MMDMKNYSYNHANDILVISLLSIMASFFIYTLFLWVISRNKVYLYYAYYLVSYLLFQLFFTGYIQWIFDVTAVYHIGISLFITLSFIYVAFFFKTILKVKQKLPKIDNAFNIIIVVLLLTIVGVILDLPYVVQVRNIVIFPITLLLFTFALIISTIRKAPFSLFLLIGWSFFILATFFSAVFSSVDFSNTIFSRNMMLISATIEVIIFSLVLATHIRSLQNTINTKDAQLQRKLKEAQLGSMIGMIAHQWKQPLAVISSSVSLQILRNELGTNTKEGIDEHLNNTAANITFLNETINDFRSFFKTDITYSMVTLDKPLNKALHIFKCSLSLKKLN
jgi:two-component system, sensor histidine kinase LadS